MNKSNKKFCSWVILLLLQFSFVQARELHKSQTEEKVSGYMYNQADSNLLAEIFFSKDHVMKFESDNETGNIYISETRSIHDGEELYGGMISGSPLEKFLHLTASDVPIPGALFDHNLLSKHRNSRDEALPLIDGKTIKAHIGERLITDEVVIDRGKHLLIMEAVSVKGNKVDAGHSCLSGTAGNTYFVATQCLLGPDSINHGSGWSQSFCDSGEFRNNIRRTSSRKVRSMYSRVANCGSGDAAIVHLQKVIDFNIKKTWYLGDDRIGGFETSTKYDNSIRLYRRAEIWKVTSGGFMRAKTVYWRNR